MAAQTLDQILSSLSSVYQPQLDSIAQQQAALPAQYDAQAQGLQAQQQSAFGDILSGARQRGLGFSGIPLADQAKYTATTYLPALANLRTSQNNAGASLTDAINKINEDKFNTGNNLYQFGVQQDQAQQQLDETKREFDAQQAAAATSAANSFNPTYGGTSPTTGSQVQDPTQAKNLSGGKSQQDAYNAIQALMQTRNTPLITQTYNAIAASAKNGNTYDQQKLQLLQQLYGESLKKNGIGVNYTQVSGSGTPTNVLNYGNTPSPIPISTASSGNIRF